MADVIYNGFLEYVNSGVIDLKNDTIKVGLFNSDYVPDKDGHDNWGDLSHECSGAGYTTGGVALDGKTVTHDDAADKGIFDAEDLVFSTVTLTDVKWAVIYKSAVNAADRKLIVAKDLGDPLNPSGSDISLQWAEGGILSFQQA